MQQERPKRNYIHQAVADKREPLVVSHEEWLARRRELLNAEKELTRHTDEVTEKLRNLPWEKVEKSYTFEGPNGAVTLKDLFGDKDDLVIYHMMFDPKDELPCPSCSMWVDGFNGYLPHIQAKAAFVVIVRAPIAKAQEIRKRRGWNCTLVSSFNNSFNQDFDVENTAERIAQKKLPPGYNFGAEGKFYPTTQWPGLSVFHRGKDGNVYRTYSAHARGLEPVNAAYRLFDLLPRGREGFHPPHREEYPHVKQQQASKN